MGKVQRVAGLQGLRISSRTRIWVGALALFHTIFALGLTIESDQYEEALGSTGVMKLATLGWWTIGFLIPAVLMAGAAVTRWFSMWAIGLFFSIIVSASWFILVLTAKADGAVWTAGGVALWGWFLFTNIMIGTSESQIAQPSVQPTGETSNDS